jgi:hypothetical protein
MMQSCNEQKHLLKSTVGSVLPEIYYRFGEAGILMDLPKNDALDINTRLSLRVFWSAQIRMMYEMMQQKYEETLRDIMAN